MRSESFFCVVLLCVLLCNLCNVQIISNIYVCITAYVAKNAY